MNQNLEISINEIILLINSKNLLLAKLKTENLISINRSNDILYNLLGVINLQLKNISLAIDNFKNSLKINSKFLSATLNLAIAYKENDDTSNAIKFYKNTILLKPSLYEVHNDLGLLYKKNKKYKLAIGCFEECLRINNKYDKAYFNLGITHLLLKKDDIALNNFKKNLEINPKNYDSFFQIAEIYRKKNKFDKSIEYYNLSSHEKTSYKKLQCFFESGSKNKYQNELKKIIELNENDRRIACLSAFASHQLKIQDEYPFCPKPIELIYKINISERIKDSKNFIELLLKEILQQKFKWEPSGRTTIKGFSTSILNDKEYPSLSNLKDLIINESKIYFNYFKNQKINFIQKKPNKFKFECWSVHLKKEGFNIPHIHPSGWLSGVFYLKIPNKITGNEAGIQFHLNGDDFKIINNSEMPSKKISPIFGDLVLFPSSLFHSTVPFNSDEERICIAFDLSELNY